MKSAALILLALSTFSSLAEANAFRSMMNRNRDEYFGCVPESPTADRNAGYISVKVSGLHVYRPNDELIPTKRWSSPNQTLSTPGQVLQLGNSGNNGTDVVAGWRAFGSYDMLYVDQPSNNNRADHVGYDDLYLIIKMPNSARINSALEASFGTYYAGARYICCSTDYVPTYHPPKNLGEYRVRGNWSCTDAKRAAVQAQTQFQNTVNAFFPALNPLQQLGLGNNLGIPGAERPAFIFGAPTQGVPQNAGVYNPKLLGNP